MTGGERTATFDANYSWDAVVGEKFPAAAFDICPGVGVLRGRDDDLDFVTVGSQYALDRLDDPSTHGVGFRPQHRRGAERRALDLNRDYAPACGDQLSWCPA
jgi:hypothetical protein